MKKNKGGDSGSLNNRVLVLRQYLTAELGLLFPCQIAWEVLGMGGGAS